MIVEYIRYDLQKHTPRELIDAYGRAGPALQAAPECLGYEVAQCSDTPARVTVRIHWTSADGHMEGFRKGPNFSRFLAEVRSFIDEIVEMKHYEPTPVAWRRPEG
jgi:hypothetical protein